MVLMVSTRMLECLYDERTVLTDTSIYTLERDYFLDFFVSGNSLFYFHKGSLPHKKKNTS